MSLCEAAGMPFVNFLLNTNSSRNTRMKERNISEQVGQGSEKVSNCFDNRVRLNKRRKLGTATAPTTNSRLIVKHRPLNETEISAQVRPLFVVTHPFFNALSRRKICQVSRPQLATRTVLYMSRYFALCARAGSPHDDARATR